MNLSFKIKNLNKNIDEAVTENKSEKELSEKELPEEELSEDKNKFSFKRLPIALKATIIAIASLVIIYVAGIIVFSFIFQPGTKINTTSVAFKTPGSVKTLIDDSSLDYKLTIKLRNNKTTFITADQVDAKYDKSVDVKAILDKQNKFKWPLSFILSSNDTCYTDITFNQGKMDDIIDSFSFMKESNMLPPKNAFIMYNSDKEKFVIKKEYNGTVLDTTKTKSEIKNAFAAAQTTLDLEESGVYSCAEIKANDKDLKKDLKLYNKYCNKKITYELGDSTKVLDGQTIMTWYSFDDDGNPSYDTNKIKEWLKSFASEINTRGGTRNFKSVDGNTYTVSGGTYGWELYEDEELVKIKELLDGGENQKRKPVMWREAAVFDLSGGPDWGDTYAEVNLTTQHMYMVKDGQVVFDTDIISGLPTSAKETPTGVYTCLEKQQNRTLVGNIMPDGQPEYQTPVAYWMRITWGGVGFHTATWQPKFGGELYKTRGSHGCINMSYDDSKTLYGLIEVGNPVIIHK